MLRIAHWWNLCCASRLPTTDPLLCTGHLFTHKKAPNVSPLAIKRRAWWSVVSNTWCRFTYFDFALNKRVISDSVIQRGTEMDGDRKTAAKRLSLGEFWKKSSCPARFLLGPSSLSPPSTPSLHPSLRPPLSLALGPSPFSFSCNQKSIKASSQPCPNPLPPLYHIHPQKSGEASSRPTPVHPPDPRHQVTIGLASDWTKACTKRRLNLRTSKI
jgi:hypothetical protein